MVQKKRRFFSCLMMVLFLMPGCTNHDGADHTPVFQQVPELRDIKPERPVRIKLKRGVSGNYSWEISGDDAGRLIEANTRLKESLDKDE